MKKINYIKKYFSILIMIGIFYPSDNFLTNWECVASNSFENNNNGTEVSRDLDKAVVRAKIWKVHTSDGLFEMSENAVENGVQNLIETFKDIGILVSIYETENIYNDSLYYFGYNGRPFHLMENNSVDTLINFFYLPSIDYTDGLLTGYGKAFNTPGNEFFVAGNFCEYVAEEIVCYELADTFIPTHELGHCLGLLHTHPGSNGEENVIRPNDANIENCEVNCGEAGDLLCDTEASISLKNSVIFDGNTCIYTSDETDECGYEYQPQLDNFMSYTHFECAGSFTPEQVDKMFNTIENNSIISQVIVNAGDLNDDLNINVIDAFILVEAILYQENITDIKLWLGDLNNDEILDINDILLLINMIIEE